jgi:hypothetical protein
MSHRRASNRLSPSHTVDFGIFSCAATVLIWIVRWPRLAPLHLIQPATRNALAFSSGSAMSLRYDHLLPPPSEFSDSPILA